ncbi:MAG: DUF4132 domain-containing protein [Clostridia bacterium]|nr:DUF4132 domain-containing protein [Clostridia bacterium]
MDKANSFDEKHRRRELSQKYVSERRKKSEVMLEKLTDEEKMFLYPGHSKVHKLENGLRDALAAGAKPSEYLEKSMAWLFEKVIPVARKEMVLSIADSLRDYQYGTSYSRRSFRSDSYAPYADMLLLYLRSQVDSIHGVFTHMGVMDVPIAKILRRELSDEANAFLDENPHVQAYESLELAYAIDNGDTEAKKAVIAIITEENGKSFLSYQLIRGVFYSHDAELHELLGKLLLAARLQEGLRQVICENADCGTKEGFLAILKVIDENNLIRFSSVKRAVATWIGLGAEDSRSLERISDKCAELIRESVCSEDKRREYLETSDGLKIHIALWSYAFHSVESAKKEIEKIIAQGTKHQVVTAGYFVRSTDVGDIKHTLAKKVLRAYSEEMDVAAMWLPCFMPDARYTLHVWRSEGKSPNINKWFESEAEAEEFYTLMWSMYAIAPKSRVYTLCPWYDDKIEQSNFAENICMMAAAFGTNEKRDEAASVIAECNSDIRTTCMEAVLTRPKTQTQRDTLISLLADKSEYTRMHAVAIVKGIVLSDEEYLRIEELFRYKSGDIRMNAIALLMRRSDENLRACVERLIGNIKEDIRLAGLDILAQLSKDPARKYITEGFMPRLEAMLCGEKLGSKEKLLLEKLLPERKEKETPKAKLFDESDVYEPKEFDAEYTRKCADAFAAYFPDSDIPAMLKGEKTRNKLLDFWADCKSARQTAEDLESLSRLIDTNKTLTWYDKDFGRDMMLGTSAHALRCIGSEEIPLAELWNAWVRDNGITNERLFRAFAMRRAYTNEGKGSFSESTKGYAREVLGAGFEKGTEVLYGAHVSLVLEYLVKQIPENELRPLACALGLWFIRFIPDEGAIIQGAHILSHSQLVLIYDYLKCRNDAELAYIFPIAESVYSKCVRAVKMRPKTDIIEDGRGGAYYVNNAYNGYYLHMANNRNDTTHRLLDINANIYAAYRGIITRRQLYEVMFGRNHMRESMETLSTIATTIYEEGKSVSGKNIYRSRRRDAVVSAFLGKYNANKFEITDEDKKLLHFVTELYEEVIPVIIDSEISRGDSPADYSASVPGIYRIYGAEYLAKILDAMGNDTIDRNSYSGWGSTFSRKSSLSYLLSICIPRDTDSAETLGKALEDKKISEKRLIEAALVSPEWIKIIGEHLDIESFESVCYYFMAHMNEKFDDKRKAIIARFTPLSEDELNMGAFDVAWFRTAHASIGEKEFNSVYDAAKYISDGAKHSRARKYADASLGRFAVDATEAEISAKRNKDLLMAYPLIPLSGEDDICRRYLYIQRFRKESKQFGSQRIASEGKATEMALKNLATNAGYADTMRLTLRMETKVIDDNRALMEEQNIDGVILKIALDENGKAGISVSKGGKALKSIPSGLKKHETVLALGELKKTLTEQYRRTRVMLEQAMEDGTAFTFGEISSLCAHPVVYPMLRNLVLISDTEAGFLCEKGLFDVRGDVRELSDKTEVKIAHPFHLYKRGIWREYQHYLFDNKIVQPFRQVFRELYVKTAEEMDMLHSLRYAGNQIQPAKTAATLKSRRWVADVEDGLQKVYYKENIVAEIYAMADWFSPADIEAPTLEWVCFADRQTGAELKIADIPDIIFSEVMRDVDLAVSVAHAGGVDPETSHSTMEMRAAILSFVLPMFRIANVKIEGHHAIIDGKFAEYSVHLGSGVVHQIGGAMIPVLPVHSQHRGKIFLPFVDDDPKTAEIISKVLLFAEDGKIKDPMILSNITR